MSNIVLAPATVHRILVRRGINRVKDLDPPSSEQLRAVLRFEHDAPGSMIHVDVKKLGRIPTGGGWWADGRGTVEYRESKRRGQGTGAVGYTYPHSTIDDHSRLAYTEPLENEKGQTSGGEPRRSTPSTASPMACPCIAAGLISSHL